MIRWSSVNDVTKVDFVVQRSREIEQLFSKWMIDSELATWKLSVPDIYYRCKSSTYKHHSDWLNVKNIFFKHWIDFRKSRFWRAWNRIEFSLKQKQQYTHFVGNRILGFISKTQQNLIQIIHSLIEISTIRYHATTQARQIKR